MVDFSKISADLQAQINQALKLEAGGDDTKVDSKAEYNKLAQILSGCNKESEAYKYIDDLMFKGLENSLVSKSVREKVANIIKGGDQTRADYKDETTALKQLLKSKELTDEDKEYIKGVIKGREISIEQNNTEVGGCETKETKAQPDKKPENQAPTQNKTEPSVPENSKNAEPSVPKKGKEYKPQPPTKINSENRTRIDNSVHSGNVRGDNNGVNVSGNGNTIIVNPTNQPEVPEDTIPAEPNKPTETPLSPEEIKDAQDNGKTVEDALVGYTDGAEQVLVKKIIEKEVNSKNVLEFLRGYEEAKGWRGDHFFEQMQTEYDFPEQQSLMRKVAGDLQGYLENKYGVDSAQAKQIAVILLEKEIDQKGAEKLDKIAEKEF